jgi:hypothetical protein
MTAPNAYEVWWDCPQESADKYLFKYLNHKELPGLESKNIFERLLQALTGRCVSWYPMRYPGFFDGWHRKQITVQSDQLRFFI